MRKLTFLFACLFIAGVSMVLAQTSISGKVISAEDGEEIVGATVMVKGTTTGTITNVNGNFTISLSGTNRTLVVSYVGMKTAEVLATPNMIVRLESDAAELEEVLVVAYGTTKRSSFTGSAAVVKSDAIEKRQASNVTNTLSGQIAGVQGINSDGAPGSGSKIRIRGIGSMYASNAPLYVVDGIPYDGDISAINTTDIESVTVLKDAASNALYGARGANGVIMITTKKGNSRVARINVDAKWGNNSRGVDNYSVMTDPGMYYETHYQALYNSQFLDGKTSHVAHDFANKNLLDAANGGLGYQVYSVPAGERLIGSNGKLNPQATLGYTEGQFTYLPDIWYDEVFKKNNLRQEYNINISGTEGKMNYYMSAGYLDDTGIIENSGLSRLSTRLNVDYQAREWLKVGSNLSYTNSKNRYPDEQTTDDDTSSANLFFVANAIAPIYPLYIRDASGKIMIDSNGYTMYDYGDGATVPKIRSFMGMSNPASAIALDNSIYADDIFNGKWFANIDITEGLKASANFGVYAANSRYNFSLNPYYGQYASTGGVANVEHNRKFAVNQNYLLTYDKEFDGVHNVGVLAGFESYAYKSQNLWGSKEKMYSNTPEISNAILNPSTESSTDTYSTMGFLARANYDYVGKYHFSASYRRDASSRFHPDHRWGNFWSGGFGWIMNKESFLEDQSWINLLKFKMSYGAQGNDDLGNYYAYLDQYSVVMQDDDFATTLKYKGNKDLTWETSHNFNTGFDFSLFADRLGGTIEYFSRTTSDMLYYKPVSPSLGYSELPVNVGSVRNAGVEIDLNGKVYSSRDLKITAYANATLLKNTILELEESLGGEWIDGSYIYKKGSSLMNRYLRKYAGVDKETGASQWYKEVTDSFGNVTMEKVTSYASATQFETGDLLPDVYGGFGTNVTYKGFDASVAFAYQLGGKIYDNTYARLMHSGYSSDAGTNWHTDILKAWTPENKDTDVPRLNTSDQYTSSASDRFLVSSNYLSLQNITIGYTLPSNLLKKYNIEKVRIYGVADNLALWAARKGLDPRQSYSASGNYTYSPIRSISGGVSISF